MTDFILKFTTGEQFVINEAEAMAIASAREDQSITISRLGIVAPKRMSMVYPKALSGGRADQVVGVLHDGTRVRKVFGIWQDANLSRDVRLDQNYYPEVAEDLVATAEEWETIKQSDRPTDAYYEALRPGWKPKQLTS